jgi:sulfatase maturation enzyme AslB (radical SAM superfamily)
MFFSSEKIAIPKFNFRYDSRVNPYFPHQVLMESTSACQLRCSMCARSAALKKGTLKLGNMEEWLSVKIMTEVAQVNPDCRLWFCFFGEPTLSKDIWRRIRLAKEMGIKATIINSNGNNLTPSVSDRLIESGLDEIYIGLDAATAETYQKVRIRGNFEKVVGNIHYLLENKKSNLKVVVQYGIYDENEHEVESFKEYWQAVGIPVFIRPKLTWLGYLSEHNPTQKGRYACPWIFDTFPIFYNGLVPYCVCDWDNRLPMGDIRKQTIAEVWQTTYRKWQNRHLKGDFLSLPRFCQHCRDWQTKPLKDTLQGLHEKGLAYEDFYMPPPDPFRLKK